MPPGAPPTPQWPSRKPSSGLALRTVTMGPSRSVFTSTRCSSDPLPLARRWTPTAREPNGRCSTRCWRRSRAGTSWYLRRPSRSWSGGSLSAAGIGRPARTRSVPERARGSDPAAGCRPSSAGARNCNCSEGASNPRAVATARSLRLSERRGSASLAYCMSSAKVCAGSASRTWKGIASRTPPASRISPSTGSCGAPVAWPTPILRKRWSERSAPASTG